MLKMNPDTNLIGSEPKKKMPLSGTVEHNQIGNILIEKVKKKKPRGILKDLTGLKRGYIKGVGDDIILVHHKRGAYVEWSDVEAIIKKYS